MLACPNGDLDSFIDPIAPTPYSVVMGKDTPYLGLFPSQPTELSLPDTVYGDDKPSFALVAQLIEQMRPSPVMSIVDLGDSRRMRLGSLKELINWTGGKTRVSGTSAPITLNGMKVRAIDLRNDPDGTMLLHSDWRVRLTPELVAQLGCKSAVFMASEVKGSVTLFNSAEIHRALMVGLPWKDPVAEENPF